MKAKSKRLSTEEKRKRLAVKLCKDLLAKLGKYKHIEGGAYCDASAFDGCNMVSKARNVVSAARKHCQVCAMGALFIEALGINGNLFPGIKEYSTLVKNDVVMREDIVRALSPAFCGWQLVSIEDAFEFGRYGFHYDGMNGSPERLRAILKHIIENKGTFPVK